MNLRVHSLIDLESTAVKWVEQNSEPCVCLISGDMGAGKTTLVKLICQKLGVDESVSSPTFSLVNEYQTTSGNLVYHFDLYRLKDEEELFDLGFEEYLDRGAYVFIEWPEIGSSFFLGSEKNISITIEGDSRLIEFS